MSHLWMIAYDISDSKVRKAVHDQLNNHGQRVQYSVFECRLEPQQHQALRAQLQALIGTDDSIRWYPLCRWCEDAIHWQGEGSAVDATGFYLL